MSRLGIPIDTCDTSGRASVEVSTPRFGNLAMIIDKSIKITIVTLTNNHELYVTRYAIMVLARNR